jgi:hypothetical protein
MAEQEGRMSDYAEERARLVEKYGESTVRAVELRAEATAEEMIRGTATEQPLGILRSWVHLPIQTKARRRRRHKRLL